MAHRSPGGLGPLRKVNPLILALLAAAVYATVQVSCGSADSTPVPVPITVVATAVATVSVKPTLPALPPAWPYIFNGDITVGGAPVPAGYTLVGRIDEYETQPIITLPGRYLALTVGPLDTVFFERPITFHLVSPAGGEVRADETDYFVGRDQPTLLDGFNLSFPSLP